MRVGLQRFRPVCLHQSATGAFLSTCKMTSGRKEHEVKGYSHPGVDRT